MMTAPSLSQKQLNFARFSIVCVDVIKLPLKDILNIYFKPTKLEKNIKACPSLCTGEYKLNPDQQRKCCFNSSNFPDYSKFDVSLLYKLIRNLCPTLEPTNKWGNKPTVNDVGVGDDIERIRVLRNAFFAHTESAEISDDDYKRLWQDAKCVINRCQQFTTSKGCKTDYNQMLTDLERQTLTFKEYTSGKERSGAIYILGDSDVLCGETACLEAEITLEQDVYLPISWDRVEGLSRKQLDIASDKYRGSNSRQLFIHSVCKDDEAGYQAIISRNQDVKIFSNEIYLRAIGDPPCLEEMDVTSTNDEISIYFVVKLLEQSPIVKEPIWTKNTLMLDLSKDKYRGGRLADKCITITSPCKEDKGDYACTVSNAVGSVSKNVKLDIPSIEIPSKSKVIFGSETRLNLYVCGYPPPDKVEWQNSVDGTTFHPIDIDGDKHVGSSTDPRSPYLLVRDATLKDQQYYRVVVSNLIGKCISSTLFLQVTGNRPNMSEGTCTLLDRSVKLRCDVFLYDESPAVKDLYWTKNGIKLAVTKSDEKYSGVDINDPSLIINSVNHNDAGDYQLTAVNAVGETRSEVIKLGVPEVHLEKQDIKEDGSMWFTMSIKSVPVPHLVQWNVKEEHSKTFQPINVNAAEYKGTSHSFPHPVLVLNHIKKLENCIIEIEVQNRIGEVKRKISGEINQGNLKTYQRTVGKFYTNSGSRLPFAKLLNGLAEKFPREKIPQLKHLIESSVLLNDNTELQKASSAADCFSILQKEDIFTPSDVMAMQFLLQETKCKELEKECIEYAEKRKAMYFYEKSPENGYQNVRLHVVENVFYFNVEDENKIRETVANIVGCSIEDIRVNGYLPSTSFFLVISIRTIYTGRLFTIQQHDKDKLMKLKIDYFKDDSRTMRVGYIEVNDEHKTSTPPNKLSLPKDDKGNIYHLNREEDWLVHDTEGIMRFGDALRWQSSSKKYADRYIDLQKELEEIYSSMQDFVKTEGFRTHIKTERYSLEKIEETLSLRENDIRKTECPIVIAGETGSGKSSIINLILGEKILPTGIIASSATMWRIKHSEHYMVSTKNFKDEEIEKISFENLKEIAEKLEVLAKSHDEKISYVDICMPVSLLDGNVMIIDTPGFGYMEQGYITEKMMSYLPNALAFVFVVDVANAGGIQEDRLLRIPAKLKHSICKMTSLRPRDVIFLLNKWDYISHEDDDLQEQFFKQSKKHLCNLWEEADESCILKMSAKKVSKEKAEYTRYFSMFINVLKETIARNENKRLNAHLRFMGETLFEFNRIVSTKLVDAFENADENITHLNILEMDLEKLKNTRYEVFFNIESGIGAFLDNASNEFQNYLHHPDFKTAVLQETNTFTRLTIGNELDTRIEHMRKAWQKEHIDGIFQKIIMGDIIRKIENSLRSLYSIEGSLKVPLVLENRISPVALAERARVDGRLGSLINDTSLHIMSPTGFLTRGILSRIVSLGFEAFNIVDDFETVREKAFQARINACTKEEIHRTLRKEYSDRIMTIIKTFLEGYLEVEINKIKTNISTVRKQQQVFKSVEHTLYSLQSTVDQNIYRLHKIKRTNVSNENTELYHLQIQKKS